MSCGRSGARLGGVHGVFKALKDPIVGGKLVRDKKKLL
jgi:hypothetical protein